MGKVALHRNPAVLVVSCFLALSGCALLTAAPPQVEVVQVELRGASLLDQSLAVALCVTNPNDTALNFRRIRVMADVSGAPLADIESEVPVRLPPHSSTLVPFAVTTTVRNLGPQLLGIFQTGAVEYRMHGTVQIDGVVALTLPFSRSGHLDTATVGGLLADTGGSAGTRCGTAS